MKLLFGTGTLNKQKISLSEQMNILKKLDIDGVELTLRFWKEFEEFSDERFMSFLRELDCNTLHAPFDTIYSRNKITDYLEKMKEVSEKINAKKIILHLYNLEDPSLVSHLPPNFVLENTLSGDWHSQKLIDFFRENEKKSFVLDTSHALHYGKEELDILIKHLANNISVIHLSNIVNGEHHRQFFKRKEDFKKLEALKPHLKDKIIVIEENFDRLEDIHLEIECIREWLNE